MGSSSVKLMWACSFFLICLFFATIPGNANALPYAESTVVVDWNTIDIKLIDGLTIKYRDNTAGMYDAFGSSSKAKVEFDPDGPDKKEKFEYEEEAPAYTDTRAAVDKTIAAANASTQNTTVTKLSGSSRAYGESGIKNKAESEAKQWMYFDVTSAGTLELTVDYFLEMDVDVEAPDEWAKAKSEVKVELGKEWVEDPDGKGKKKKDYEKDELKIELKDLTGQFSENYEGTLTVSYLFGVDDIGFMTMKAKSKAEAYIDPPVPTPEPATMLLLGSGLIGLAGLRRKFSGKGRH